MDRIIDIVAKLVGLGVGINVVMQTFSPIHPFLGYWVLWFITFYVIVFGFGERGRACWRRLHRVSLFAVLAVVPILVGVQVYQYRQETREAQAKAVLEQTLATGLWVAYEPISIDPYSKTFPSSDEVRKELQIILGGGFDSLITFSASGSLAEIPKIAKELGFKGVIMGITDITDKGEIHSAISAKDYVDAYCVGHMFTDYPYSELDLREALNTVRQATSRPVTTTLRPNGYLAFPKISYAVDFFFPDVHANWYSNGTAAHARKTIELFVGEIRKLQERYPDKAVLLKMISIPSEEVPGASTEQQYQFYREMVEYIKSSMTFPERLYPSYFSAFDLLWKSPERKWPPGERYVGFYDAQGKPKIATIRGVKVRVVDALHWSRISTPKNTGTKGTAH